MNKIFRFIINFIIILYFIRHGNAVEGLFLLMFLECSYIEDKI